MKKVLLLTFSLGMIAIVGYAQQKKAWSFSNADPNAIAADKAVKRQSFPTEFKLFELDAPALKQQLFSILSNAGQRSTVISVPNVKGELEQFEIVEASNFEPALQARFPEIRAYSGSSLSDPGATIKLSFSPQGMQSMVFRTETENEFIEPYSADHTLYAVYRSQRASGKLPWSCTTEDVRLAEDVSGQRVVKKMASGSSSGNLKTLRLAQSVNGEYSNYFGATSAAQVGLVLAAVNNTLTRCNGVFEKDLAIHLNLIPNTTSVFYYNPGSDPYTTLSSWNLQLQQTLTSVIGNANYDIGHMFGASGGGGNAGCIGCVCVNPANNSSKAKGSGITSPADGIPAGDNFDIDYVAHEIGHQLGANHTFSFSLEGTGQNKEVGSGITIMGYAGITSYDVARHSIDIFHATSIAQIQANLANKTCPVTTNITGYNTAPSLTPGTNFTIPISTPFALTANASDAQSDPLTYCWEQNDNATTSGSSSVASPTKATGPNFLSFPPTTSPVRLFPKLATILAGANVSGPLPGGDAVANTEALSSVSRTLNFRLTVRDNHPYSSSAPVSVGQTAFTDVVVSVTNTSGPFAVTAPNTNVTWTGGSSATVTWSVNGTNAGSVNCQLVKILLSTDGGNTFPTVLASSTANDGSEVVTVPNTPGTTNRIKVESIGNIFFDISNANFTITGGVSCGVPTGLASSALTQTGATVSWTAVSGATSYDVDYKAASSGTWINAANNTTSLSTNISGLLAGTLYDWRVKTDCGSSSSAYASAQFTTSAAPVCNNPTGLASSAITETSATISWSAVIGALGYDVDYKTASSGTWISAATGTTLLSVNLGSLTAGTVYDWRVKTTCSSSSSSYVQAQFTTSTVSAPCNAATGLTSTNITENTATVSWTAVSGAVSYEVGYKTAASSTWTTAASATTSISVNLGSLSASTTYDWRVRTNCGTGLSTYAQAQFTTEASTAPPCPGAFDVSTNGSASGAATIPFNTDVYGLIEARGDVDFYRIIPTASGSISISLTNLPGDYHLELRASNGNTILQSSTNNGTADENITAAVTAGSTYYIRVYPKNNGQWNANNCYTLNVSTGGAARAENAELIVGNQLLVSPNPASNFVTLKFQAKEAGNATVSIVGQTGSTLLSNGMAVNAGENNKRLYVGNLTTGFYYIKLQTGTSVFVSKVMVSK